MQKKVDSLISAGTDAVFASDLDGAQEYADQALRLAKEINWERGLGKHEELRGFIIQNRGDVPAAMTAYYNALEIYRRTGYTKGIANIHSLLGFIALDKADAKQAKYYLNESMRLNRELNDTSGIAAAYINLGLVYSDLEHDIDRSLANLIRAAELFSVLRDTLRLGIAYGNMGAMYYGKGRMKDALDHRMKSLHCFTVAKRQDMVISTYAQIGETFRRLGEYDSARVYLERGLRENLAIGNKAGLIWVYGYLFQLDSTLGRYKEALHNKIMYSVYRDSVNAINSNSEITRTEMRYEYRQKEKLAQQELDRERLIRNSMIGGIATLLAFTVVFFRQRNKVKREKARSEELLLNILPAETAEELKATGTSAARQYDQVSVLFTDFVNFTGIAESLTPTELVAEVHRNFTAIDTIIEKHGLEKIKTIGDAYLAVCGMPHAREDHALRVVRAAIEIVDHISQHGGAFQIRIGINSGPVVAGIVGVKKFAYDIWGDTVNIASRMENASETGRINISESTYQLVKEHVHCEYRGLIDVKGKGAVGMYYVLG